MTFKQVAQPQNMSTVVVIIHCCKWSTSWCNNTQMSAEFHL